MADVRKLTKSRTNRMIDGVCGGIAAYAGLDPTLVRVAMLLLVLFGGAGIVFYIIGMILMPAAPADPADARTHPTATKANSQFWGVILVVIGVVWLSSNLGWHFWHPFWGVSWGILIPLLFILAGAAFLLGGRNYVSAAGESPHSAAQAPPPATERPRMMRSHEDRKIFGVCSGLGAYLGVDPTVVRLAAAAAAIASFGLAVVVYVALAIIMPSDKQVRTVSS